MPELIKVAARVRPADDPRDIAVSTDEIMNRVTDSNGRAYIYDAVFGMNISQDAVFSLMAKPIIEACVNGYNGTVFVYGQTGSGKTYTMLGAENDADKRGLIPRSLEHLFGMLEKEREKKGATFQHSCKCSFVELYNEELYDLLDEKSNEKLRLRQSDTVIVEGAAEAPVLNCNEAMEILMQGWKNREVAETAMNRESSRSHAIFIISLETRCEYNGIINRKRSRINLVDLAGSERQENTKSSGARLKEAASINKSLSVLARVIDRLSQNAIKRENGHVPYRDSKLTHLLSDSLGGNARTAVIVNVHPNSRFIAQTISTLKFAENVKHVENVAKINEDVTSRDIEAWKEEIIRLKQELREVEKEKDFFEQQLGDRNRKDRRRTRYTPHDNNLAARYSFMPVLEPSNATNVKPMYLDMHENETVIKQCDDHRLRIEELSLSKKKDEDTIQELLSEKKRDAAERRCLENRLSEKQQLIEKLYHQQEQDSLEKTALIKQCDNHRLQIEELSLSKKKDEDTIHELLSEKERDAAERRCLENRLSEKQQLIEKLHHQQEQDSLLEHLGVAKKKDEDTIQELLSEKETDAAEKRCLENRLSEKQQLIEKLRHQQEQNSLEKADLIKQCDNRRLQLEQLSVAKKKDEDTIQELLLEKERDAPERTDLANRLSEKQQLIANLHHQQEQDSLEKAALIKQRDEYAEELAKASSHTNQAQKIKYVEKLRARINELETENANLKAAVSTQGVRTSSRLAKRK
ncbi:hypothetical protein QR680_009058 [Steinernema hermaphroditum]|uniref:Kinesin-like protein n=1 Tax=Steinernema hermaphroditum TaxID=289476 RepID=A0AA39M8Z8_9BILA|nr:hypothetical protein QR680_009058 [Steinernema hermaphroditum]